MSARWRSVVSLPAAAALAALALAGCHGSAAPGPFGVRYAAAAGDRLYVLDEAGARIVRLAPDGTATGAAKVGPHPQGLAATADGSWVVTLSAETQALDVVRTAADGPLAATELPVRAHHNAFAVSNAGANRYAVTYVDLSKLDDVVVDGTASFNEITVVDLNGASPVATSVVVGFNPRQVVFTPDGSKAVVLSQSFASIVPLASPLATVRVPLGANTAANPVTPETAMTTQDGSAAFVARAGSSDVFVISLDPPSVNIVDVGFSPTRFVASADGGTVVAIAHGLPEVSLVDLATLEVRVAAAPGPITDAAVPSDPADRRLLLWGAGSGREEMYALDVDAAAISTIALVNPPTQIAIAPSGAAVILHEKHPTPGGDNVQQFFDEHDALSVLDPSMHLLTPIALDVPPASVAFFDGANGHTLAAVPLTGSAHLAEIDLDDQLASAVRVSAVPDAALPITGDGVAIVHDQPFGLVTFLAPDGVTTHVASGFLLDSKL